MKPQQAKQFAVMSVERGETIAGIWVAPPVTDIGTYKLVAKQNQMEVASGRTSCNGRRASRQGVSRHRGMCGTSGGRPQRHQRRIARTFGPSVQLQPADADFFTLGWKEAGQLGALEATRNS